jgi:hypothetical protein
MYYVKNKKIIVFHVEFFLHKIPIVLLQIFVDTVKQIKTYTVILCLLSAT